MRAAPTASATKSTTVQAIRIAVPSDVNQTLHTPVLCLLWIDHVPLHVEYVVAIEHDHRHRLDVLGRRHVDPRLGGDSTKPDVERVSAGLVLNREVFPFFEGAHSRADSRANLRQLLDVSPVARSDEFI